MTRSTVSGDSHHNDTDSRTALAQPPCYGEAILIWQTDIEQYERWTIALHELPQSSASAYTSDSKILARQILHQEVALRCLVLDYDNVWAGLHALRLQPPR